MRTKAILLLIIILTIIALLAALKSCQLQKQKADRYLSNTYALTEELRLTTFRDSLARVEVRSMELKQSEFEKIFAEKDALIRELRIGKPTQIVEIETKRTDTLTIKVDTKDSVKRFKYEDKWLSLQGDIRRDTLRLNYEMRDSLVLIAHRIPKRFLGFLWYTKKTKVNKVEAVSFNPKTKITGLTSIKIDN